MKHFLSAEKKIIIKPEPYIQQKYPSGMKGKLRQFLKKEN